MDFFQLLFVISVLFKTVLMDYTPQQLAAANVLESLISTSTPTQVRNAHRDFCNLHYGAEKDPIYYQKFGSTLQISSETEDNFQHISENSAVFGFETNIPAFSHIEYGLDTSYGSSTTTTDRYFFLHIHHLTSLSENTLYHYRYVVEDERSNIIYSNDATFTTTAHDDVNNIYIPGGLTGPPYNIDQSDKTYILESDITADQSDGIIFYGKGTTIDLNGHTIFHGTSQDSHGDSHGIRYFVDEEPGGAIGKVVNGFITQIENTYMESATDAFKYHNLRLGQNNLATSSEQRSEHYLTAAGLVLTYWVPEGWSMILRYNERRVDIKWNIFDDQGVIVVNRHYPGSRVLGLSTSNDNAPNYHLFHHNLVKRHRQNGISGLSNVFHNEIYADSWDTNSFSINPSDYSANIYDNKLFLTGYHALASGWASFDLKLHDNFIHMEGILTGTNRCTEYTGDALIGFRITNYGEGGTVRNNLKYYRNTIIGYSRSGVNGIMRGLQLFSDVSITDLTSTDSYVRIHSRDDDSLTAACVVSQGIYTNPSTNPVVFINEVYESNIANVRFGDSYSRGNNHHFYNCTFKKNGNHSSYHTIVFDGYYWTFGHQFIDCSFEDGASWDDVWFRAVTDSSQCFFHVMYSVTFYTNAFDRISLTNNVGEVVFIEADSNGVIVVNIAMVKVQGGTANVFYNPYTVGYGVLYASTMSLTVDRPGIVVNLVSFSQLGFVSIVAGVFVVVSVLVFLVVVSVMIILLVVFKIFDSKKSFKKNDEELNES